MQWCMDQVRWTEMEAVRGGKPPAALLADFKVAMRSSEQQWQVTLLNTILPCVPQLMYEDKAEVQIGKWQVASANCVSLLAQWL